jgi:signal transduction histidine kinase
MLIFGTVKSKQSIRIVIALMSLALAGVVIIQFLWLKSAISSKQEEFDRNVKMAMVRTSADLENKYGVHLITEKLRSDSNARKEVLKQDPGFFRFMISVDENKRKNEPDMMPDNNEDAWSADNTDSAEPGSQNTKIEITNNNHVVTMVNVSSRGNQELLIQKSVYNEHPEPIEKPIPPVPVQPVPDITSPPAQLSQCKLINIVKNAADEYAMSKMTEQDICEVIDSAKIRSAIKTAFARQGLPSNFVFATYCVDGDSLIINKAASANPLKDFTYKSPLLATDFIQAGSLLLIDFPGHFKYVFASMAGMLALSLFFTLTIVAAFAYALHVIFQQKKLSDITNDFINNMTHELKTPLATISMTADTLGLGPVLQSPDKVQEYSGMIKHEVKKLSRHVDRILEAAILEKNGKSTQTELISLNKLIEDEVKIFEGVAAQRDGKIELLLPADDLRVYANRDMLRGVICNLLDNAIKYSKEVPEIKASLKRIDGKAQICIRDKGVGIAKNDQKLIFEKFYRASTGNRHDVKGFGLGLSFVKNVVESLHGKIWLESELGTGSSFFVELPIT